MTPTLYWIPGPWTGKLAIAARPRGGDWLDDELAALRHAGIDQVVSLLEPKEAAQLGLGGEAAAARASGLEYLSFPIPDRGVPAPTAPAVSLLRGIVEALDRGHTVAVHCRQGPGRAATIAAGALVAHGVQPDEAIKTVRAARGELVPETADQTQWIHELPSVQPAARA